MSWGSCARVGNGTLRVEIGSESGAAVLIHHETPQRRKSNLGKNRSGSDIPLSVPPAFLLGRRGRPRRQQAFQQVHHLLQCLQFLVLLVDQRAELNDDALQQSRIIGQELHHLWGQLADIERIGGRFSRVHAAIMPAPPHRANEKAPRHGRE
jgi:hypothetical protein